MVDAKILKYGLFLLVAGLAMVGGYMAELSQEPLLYTAGMICALIGVILMGAGFLTIVGLEYMPKKGIREGDKNVFTIALLRCMLAISIADNFLDDDEVIEIRKIYKHLTQAEIPEEVVRKTAQEMIDAGTDIESELLATAGTMDKDHKDKLVIASLYILAADGDMDERELVMLDNIREGLNLSINHVEKIKTNFLSKRELREV